MKRGSEWVPVACVALLVLVGCERGARADDGEPWVPTVAARYPHDPNAFTQGLIFLDGALYENGVGAVRRFLEGFDAGLPSVPRLDGRRLRLVTGRSMAPFLRERAGRLATATGAAVDVVEVENRFFGGNIAVAGLMVGEDLHRVLAEQPAGHRYLLPDVCLSQGRFLDGSRPEDLPRPVEVVPTDGHALRLALGLDAAALQGAS